MGRIRLVGAMGTRLGWGAAACLVAALAIARSVEAQAPGYPRLTEEEELRLAMSAGPLTMSRHADVYRMTDRGFVRAIEGTNGWACIVVRSARIRSQLAPHCLNPYAVESVLPAFLREGELQARGMDPDSIDGALKRAWSSGELKLPEGPAYAYMLSEGQRLGANGSKFRPHFMLYMPYVTNEDIGGDRQHMEFPFVGPYENHPLSTVVILMEEFVSPASVVLPER